MALDRSGNLYIADRGNHRIRRVGARNRVITTVAGNGQRDFSGDGGPAGRASLADPFDLTADRRGNLYVADTGNKRVRRFDARNNRYRDRPGQASLQGRACLGVQEREPVLLMPLSRLGCAHLTMLPAETTHSECITREQVAPEA